jgi:hypothetical protein
MNYFYEHYPPRKKWILTIVLAITSVIRLQAQSHINDYVWYNDGAEVTCQAGCLVTIQGDMTNNGTSTPAGVHLNNNGFLWVLGNLYGDDALQQRGTGTTRLMNETSVFTAPYPTEYQVISGGYRVRGGQAATGVDDGSFYNLEVANDQGLTFIKNNDADVRGSVNFAPAATTQDGNSIDATTATNRILTYDPGTAAAPAAAPANGSNYPTVFGLMNTAPGLGNYLNNTITVNGTTSSVDNAYIQGKHRRAILAAGGAFGYPLGLEPSTANGRGVQYSLYTHNANTYDVVTGYFEQASSNTGTASTFCSGKIPDCWAGATHGEWIYGALTAPGTGAFNLEIFPQHYGCTGKTGYVMTQNNSVPSQLSATDNCESNPVTLDQNWNAGISANTQFSFVSYTSVLPLKLISFTGTPAGNAVKLNWVTANETNVLSHTIQKSINGTTWTDVTTIPARNLSRDSYTGYDYSPAPCKNYYRLRTNEANGQPSYSSIAMVQYNCGNASMFIYPNPASTTLTISLSTANGATQATLYKANGQLIGNYKLNAGTNTIDVSNFANGVYTLRTVDNKGNTNTQKIIVQHN